MFSGTLADLIMGQLLMSAEPPPLKLACLLGESIVFDFSSDARDLSKRTSAVRPMFQMHASLNPIAIG
jgi:hypothetical protein